MLPAVAVAPWARPLSRGVGSQAMGPPVDLAVRAPWPPPAPAQPARRGSPQAGRSDVPPVWWAASAAPFGAKRGCFWAMEDLEKWCLHSPNVQRGEAIEKIWGWELDGDHPFVRGPWDDLLVLVGIEQEYVVGWDCDFRLSVALEPKLGAMKEVPVLGTWNHEV